ncbi:MAG: transcription repressor NadR [Lachnospiraceae bacterium]|nr:transcription repressor NadR [Lachnospiraceae bacterium]
MILEGEERRQAILEYLTPSQSPVNGTELAKHFGVSRQVIVQDIALLRAQNHPIWSTNKGYMLTKPLEKQIGCRRVIAVQHTQEQTIEEMQAIVDFGGHMLDIFVDHDLYGEIRAELIINDLQDALDFCERMNHSSSKPLKVLTGDTHYHTIVAPSEKAMQMILQELAEKGILVTS